MLGKFNQISYPVFAGYDDTEICVKLTKRDIVAIYAQLEFLRYETRWTGLQAGFNPTEYTESLEKRILDAMGCCGCDDVLNCIETSEEIKELIQKYAIGAGESVPLAVLTDRALGYANDSISFVEDGVCNKARLFNAVSEFVDVLHKNNLDFFDLAETLTNPVEVANALSELGGELLAVINTATALLDFANNTLRELYNTVWTDEVRDRIRCGIFCAVQNNCAITINDFLVYFQDRTDITQITQATPAQLCVWFAGLDLDTSTVVDALMFIQLKLASLFDNTLVSLLKNDVVSGVIKRLLLQLLLATNDEDTDYILLCECVDYALTVLYGTVLEQSASVIRIQSVAVFNNQVCNDNQGVIFATLDTIKTLTSLSSSPVIAGDYPNRYGIYFTKPDETLAYFGYGGAPLIDAIGLQFVGFAVYGECATSNNYTFEIGVQ